MIMDLFIAAICTSQFSGKNTHQYVSVQCLLKLSLSFFNSLSLSLSLGFGGGELCSATWLTESYFPNEEFNPDPQQ